MPDNKSEATAIWKQYYGDPEGLANHLTFICICQPGVVYEVFNILNNESRLDVGCRFAKKINKASLYKLASTPDGLIVCRVLSIILNTHWKMSAYTSALTPSSCQQTESVLMWVDYVIKNAATIGNEKIEPRQLSQCEMDWYTNYNSLPIALQSGPRKKFNSDICWQLPRQGAGFVVYNPDDLNEKQKPKYKDKHGYDQIGTKETVEAIITLAREWSVLHFDRKLQIGDMSRPGGINTPDHAGHETGKIVDIRPLRKDSKTGLGANLTYFDTGVYDQELTKDFVRLALKLFTGMLIRFNDPKIANAAEFSGKIKTDAKGVHNDHLHLEFP